MNEDELRNLDTILQRWAAVHRKSMNLGSQLYNLQEQLTKTANASVSWSQQLTVELTGQIEVFLVKIRQLLNDYVAAIQQLQRLRDSHTEVGADGYVVTGITNKYVKEVLDDRYTEYLKEYQRRCLLLEQLEGMGVLEFAREWLVCQIDYQVEEDYLDRLRLSGLIQKWTAVQREMQFVS